MTFLVFVIALVIVFDFINGFHDCANSISTIVSTRVLTPFAAVMWAAFFNFAAFMIFKLHVASTIGKGIVKPEMVTLAVIVSGLAGAIFWNLLTWWWGLPSSSSHALVGGFAGAAVVKGGFSAIQISGITKIIAFIFVAPVMGFAVSYLICVGVLWMCRRFSPAKVDKYFRRLQLLSAALFSLGHGGNDAQKSMGLIWVSLIVTGHLAKDAALPFWVVFSCYTAIGFGTLFGGWRIVKTMGQKITKLNPFEGFCAETAGAITLFSASSFGIPVSTTHTITGSIMGVGARQRLSAVRWGVASNILWAWILTIPASAAVGGLTFLASRLFAGK